MRTFHALLALLVVQRSLSLSLEKKEERKKGEKRRENRPVESI